MSTLSGERIISMINHFRIVQGTGTGMLTIALLDPSHHRRMTGVMNG